MHNIHTTALAPLSVPESQTNAPITPAKPIAAGGQRHRFEVVLGKVVGTPSVKLQHGVLPGVWADTKSAAAAANAGTTCAFTGGSQVIAATAHGLSVGQWVSFSTSGVLPGAIVPNALYEVSKVIDANSFEAKLYDEPSLGRNLIDNDGSGTHKVHAAASVAITFQPEVVGDQTHLPLRPRQRLVVTTGAGEEAQVLAVVASHSL